MVLMVLFWQFVFAGLKIEVQTTSSFKQNYCDHIQWGQMRVDVVLALENYGRGTEKDSKAKHLTHGNSLINVGPIITLLQIQDYPMATDIQTQSIRYWKLRLLQIKNHRGVKETQPKCLVH